MTNILPETPTPATRSTDTAEIERLAQEVVDYWTAEFRHYVDAEGHPIPHERPVAALVANLLALSSYDGEEARRLAATYIERITGFTPRKLQHRTVLIAASENGVWASELCIPAALLLAAGYGVVIATELGAPPHMLSVSCDPTFIDGPLGVPVVSQAEADLADRFKRADTVEGRLIQPGAVRSLHEIIRPPLVADYLKDQAHTMRELQQGMQALAGWVDRYDALIVAGGSGAVAGFAMNGGLHHLILVFHRLGRPIAAECNGVFALAQALDPVTGRSVLDGRFATTHSKSHEYRRGGWGWARRDNCGTEVWTLPGADGNPIVDSEPFVRNAVGVSGSFRSPPATPYAVAVDGHLITARTTPDGGPATAALIAFLEGWRPDGPRFAEDDSGFKSV